MNPELLERNGMPEKLSLDLPGAKAPDQLGRAALSSEELQFAQISIALDKQDEELVGNDISAELAKIPYHRELLDTLMEHGDYEGRPNTLKDLLKDMEQEDTGKGRRNNIIKGVHGLSNIGLVRTRKTINKGPNGDEHEVFSPLNKPGNFIILDRELYALYFPTTKSEY